MGKSVIYLSAPYRAGTEWGVYLNVQSAHFYAKELWRRGWCCISPVSNTAFMGETDDFDKWIAGDLELVSRSNAWVGAPGWERSEGCRMKIKELRCEDYLEWLKGKEELTLYDLELGALSGHTRRTLGEELQIIRELKDIVAKYEGKDEKDE